MAVKIINIEALEETEIQVEFFDSQKVRVQLAGGDYKPALGCLIFVNDEEHDSGENEELVEAAIDAAEKFAASQLAENFTDHALGFNAAFNNNSFCLRVENESDAAQIVSEAHSYNDYDEAFEILKSFDSESAGWAFVNQFKTDEHHDFVGLKAMLHAIKKEANK
jgi:hypothetical protein